MKICVAGLGSISKRHIKNLKSLYPDADIDILRHVKNVATDYDPASGVSADLVANTGGSVFTDSEYGHEVYSVEALKDKYDAVFITNPTTLHMTTLKKLIDRSDAFFIEKPLRPIMHADTSGISVNEDMNIIDELPDDKVFYVACPMRYTTVVRWLKDNLDPSSVLSIRAISSSYLPEWRPGTDYSKCYSARRSLGGGVAADLIHEWDYISYIFGRPDKIMSIERKLSSLDADVEDIAVYIGEYPDKIAEVHLDYFGRSTRRELELFTTDDTIICDFINNKITYLKSGRVIELDEERDDYQTAELKHFFDIAEGRIANDSSAHEAEALLELIEI